MRPTRRPPQMASVARHKSSAKRPAHPPVAKKPARPVPKKAKPAAKKERPPARRAPAASSGGSVAKPKTPEPDLEVPLPEGRRHVLSLSFVRDGDEFLARLETDSGHITEFKNRSLDQLLTLVAGELEDLVE